MPDITVGAPNISKEPIRDPYLASSTYNDMASIAESPIVIIGMANSASINRSAPSILRDRIHVDNLPPIKYPIDKQVMKIVIMPPQTNILLPKNGDKSRPPRSSMPITKNPLQDAAIKMAALFIDES